MAESALPVRHELSLPCLHRRLDHQSLEPSEVHLGVEEAVQELVPLPSPAEKGRELRLVVLTTALAH